MALAVFAPSIAPSPGTGFKPKIKLLEAEFDDGYTQPLPDGLNHIKQVLTLRWDGLDNAQAAEIYGFLNSKAGYIPFYYTPVGDVTASKWRCKEWSKDRPSGKWTIGATLEQDFTNAL